MSHITKTAIGNHLRKQPNGDVGMYRNGFKDGVAWAQARLTGKAQPEPVEQRDLFEAWAEPILGDNPTWRESGDCELAWRAWLAAAKGGV